MVLFFCSSGGPLKEFGKKTDKSANNGRKQKQKNIRDIKVKQTGQCKNEWFSSAQFTRVTVRRIGSVARLSPAGGNLLRYKMN